GEQSGFGMNVSLEAKTEGYYAAHLEARSTFEIPRIDWDTQLVEISVELQITTQLQEVILSLTHKFYEERREREPKRDQVGWQWDYQSPEFSANYLGHVLHFIEGTIIEV